VTCPGRGVGLPAGGGHAQPRGLVTSPQFSEVYGVVLPMENFTFPWVVSHGRRQFSGIPW
jgi:hypothetical protein